MAKSKKKNNDTSNESVSSDDQINDVSQSEVKKLISKEIINLNRQALHAHSIDFELLISNGKRLKLEAPIPTVLRKLEDKLSSYEN